MKIRRIGATLVVAGLATAGATALTAPAASAATTNIAMVCKQNPNITGDTNANFAVSYSAPGEVELGDSVFLNDVRVPFNNAQGFNLDIGPGEAFFTVENGSPAAFSQTFAKVNVPDGSSTEFGPFSEDLEATGLGTLSIKVASVKFDVALAGGGKLTEVTCTPTGSNVLATVSVVSPPPPGAPNANPDSAEVKPGESVNIDVLDNDEAAELLRASLGEVSLPEIMNAPNEGTAEVEDDGTITYTANGDTTATSDSFDYRICSEFDVPEAAFGKAFRPRGTAFRPRGEALPCDTTTVSINILQPQATTVPPTEPTDPPVTTAGGVSPTTDELPITGSSSTPLGIFGFGIALVGLGLFAAGRRRHAVR